MTPLSTGPFKFLDAYSADDSKTFFGRAAETEALYTLVVKSRLVLVYGPSGSGKTSLIQCGLANRFKPTDWFPVFVRRNDNLNTSLDQKIRAEAVTEIEPEADIVAAARSLYLDYYRPLYFIFDQFEELFILGKPEEEAKFFASVQGLLASDLNCKIIISMREEYIALLQNFERAVPTLFDSRLRVEQMTLGTVEGVILGMAEAAGIKLEHGPETARRIIAQIGDRRAGVQLAYLQVYLDKLYREAEKSATPMLFTDALVDRTGKLGDVMADFLEDQTQAIANSVRSRHPSLPKGSVHRVLEALTTMEGTKLPIARAELGSRLPELEPMLDALLAALEQSRIIRREGDIIEVSHDQLAKRVAERRSADSKALLRVEKLVRDRLAGYDQTKTYLAAEELAVVQPVLPQLGLNPAEAAFVRKSRKKLRWRRLRKIIATTSIIAILVVSLLLAVIFLTESQETVEQAVKTTSDISETIAADQDKVVMQQALLGHLKALIKQLDETNRQTTGDTAFWLEIIDGDIQQQNENWSEARKKFQAAKKEAESAKKQETEEGVESDVNWLRNKSIALGRLGSVGEAEAFVEGISEGEAQKRFDTARGYYREALAIDLAQRKDNPSDPEALHDLVVSHGALAFLEFNTGRLDAARKSALDALANARELDTLAKPVVDEAADPPDAAQEARTRRLWATDHGMYQSLLGDIEWLESNYREASKAYAASAAVYGKIVPADRASQIAVIRGYYNASDAARVSGQWEMALALHEKALAEFGLFKKKASKPVGKRTAATTDDPDQKAWGAALEKQLRAIEARNTDDTYAPDQSTGA